MYMYFIIFGALEKTFFYLRGVYSGEGPFQGPASPQVCRTRPADAQQFHHEATVHALNERSGQVQLHHTYVCLSS